MYLVSFDEGKVDDGGVVGLDTRDGIKEAKILEGMSHSEGSKRVIGGQLKWPSEPNTVEAHGLDSLGNGIKGLLA